MNRTRAAARTETRRRRAREAGENYPVALRWLPAQRREHLHAVYATGRLIDDTGDLAPGDRTAQLLALRADLTRIWQVEEPEHPVLRALAPTVAACRLSQEPFELLVEAGLIDQRGGRYQTFDELLGYCRYSAIPLGHIVLQVFEQASQSTMELSDRVCAALQVLEHAQDIAEDYASGRVYVPQSDLAEFGVAEHDLAATGHAGPGRCAVVTRQVDRAAAMLDDGAALVGALHGSARVAVAGYVGGGYATVKALRAARGDVWRAPVTPRRSDIVRSMTRQLMRAVMGSQ